MSCTELQKTGQGGDSGEAHSIGCRRCKAAGPNLSGKRTEMTNVRLRIGRCLAPGLLFQSATEKYQPYVTCLSIVLRWGTREVMTGVFILGFIESTKDRSLFIQAAQWH